MTAERPDEERTVKAALHLHTRHSWDGLVRPSVLVDRLADRGFDLLLVTDHDTFEGSIAAALAAERKDERVTVPLAAEVRTERGDVVVVLPEGPPPPVAHLKKWEALPRAVRDAGGLLWLPHPYRGHGALEDMACQVDVIEVFNARCTDSENEWAAELCARHGKTPAFASDAHLLREAGAFPVHYEDHGSPMATLRTVPTRAEPIGSPRSNRYAAEVVHGIRRMRPGLVGYYGAVYVAERLREAFSR